MHLIEEQKKDFWGKLPLFTFVFSMMATLAVVLLLSHADRDRNRERCRYIAASHATNLASVISNACSVLYIFNELFQENPGLSSFERVSERVISLYPYIRNVEMAPNGIISRVYPLLGNHEALGYNIFEDLARENKRMTLDSGLRLAGPFHLEQGGVGIVGRLPLYLGKGDEKFFWGFVCITFSFSAVLDKAAFNTLGQRDLAYELWTDDPPFDTRLIAASAAGLAPDPVIQPVALPQRTWQLRLSPTNGWIPRVNFWVRFLVGLSISILLTLLAKAMTNILETKRQLEILSRTDALTGLPNRLHIIDRFKHFHKASAHADVALCFIDLNGFKQINDTLGHRTGDLLLKEYAARLRAGLAEGELAARFGGDEFVLLLQAPCGHMQKHVEAILERTRKPFLLDGTSHCVGSSVGVALVTRESLFTETLRRADEAMYRSKQTPGHTPVYV